jgi:hypothetical protein
MGKQVDVSDSHRGASSTCVSDEERVLLNLLDGYLLPACNAVFVVRVSKLLNSNEAIRASFTGN